MAAAQTYTGALACARHGGSTNIYRYALAHCGWLMQGSAQFWEHEMNRCAEIAIARSRPTLAYAVVDDDAFDATYLCGAIDTYINCATFRMLHTWFSYFEPLTTV
eukprot:1612521-Prymnesium_polylepis.1